MKRTRNKNWIVFSNIYADEWEKREHPTASQPERVRAYFDGKTLSRRMADGDNVSILDMVELEMKTFGTRFIYEASLFFLEDEIHD